MSLFLVCCAWVPATQASLEYSTFSLGAAVSQTASSVAEAGPVSGEPAPFVDPVDASAPADLALVPATGEPSSVLTPAPVERNFETDPSSYSSKVFARQAKSIPWRFGGAAAAITATGFANWKWGSSSFRFDSEGWIGKDTSSLGMDKFGHAYSTYVLTEFFTDGINKSDRSSPSSSYTAALLAMGLMTYIEVFDGFSKEHGFSPEDLAADAIGALFSVARRSIPGMREKVDFRLLYAPSRSTFRALSCFPEPFCEKNGATARSPITDYVNQRYLLAVKLSGFELTRDTPFRFLELHGGYYARGFTQEEEDAGDPLRRRLFVGAGLNVSELLFSRRPGRFGRAIKSVLEYIQPPYVAVHTN